MPEATPSLRETLEAANAAQAAPEAAPEPVAPAPAAAPEAAAAPAADGQPRGPDGKFAPKTTDAAAPTAAAPPISEAAPPAGQEPQPEAIRVPASLPAPLKAAFKDLPPEWRDAILRQEDSVQTAKTDWGKKGERLNRYEEIVAPRRDRIAFHGVDEFTWLSRLAAAEDILDKDPVQGIGYLARLYGVNLQQVGVQTNGAQAAEPQLHPVLQQLQGQVQTLTTQLTQREQAELAARQADAAAEIQAFRADPKNMYFDDVAVQIGQLLRSEQAKSLQEAYDMAVWASPTIRPLLLKEQTSAAERERQTAERARAQAAQRASGSVTGAPGTAAAPSGSSSTGNLRADLENARAQLGARV